MSYQNITAVLSAYAHLASPTFTGTVTVPAPVNPNDAATRAYVDSVAISASLQRDPIDDPDINDVVAAVPGAPVAGATYIAFGGAYPQNWGAGAGAVVSGDIVARKEDNSGWIVIKNLAANDRVGLAWIHGAVSAGLLVAGFFKGDLAQYVAGDPALVASWTFPNGRGLGGVPEVLQGITVYIDEATSEHVGQTYLYDATIGHAWLQIGGAGFVQAGTYLHYTGTVLNVTLVAGVDFLAPAGNGSGLTGITALQVGAPSGSGNSSGTNTGDQTSVTGNAGSANVLQTPRLIYGNSFNGSANLGQIIGSTYGGTGNGFTKFSGATTAEKTYTLPDASASIACLDQVQSFTKAQRSTPVALAIAANAVAVDLSLSNNFTLTLQATTAQTLSNPSNAVAGQSGQIAITQNGTPSVLNLAANWISTDGTTLAVSTTAGAVNLLTYYVVDATHIWCSLSKHGVA
jgi:hypothetical protein